MLAFFSRIAQFFAALSMRSELLRDERIQGNLQTAAGGGDAMVISS
jgi:hypothetical protein